MNVTMPQHLAALQLANEVRLARSELLKEIHALDYTEGRELAADVLLDLPACVETLRVSRFLVAIKRMYGSRVRAALERRHISDHRTLGSLTRRQRVELADALRAPWRFE